jgi:hypothetical protein
LFSVAAHAGVGLVFFTHFRQADGNGPSAHSAASPLAVRLVQPHRRATRGPVAPQPADALSFPPSHSDPAPLPAPGTALLPEPPERSALPFFSAGQVTDAPRIASGILGTSLLIVPGVSAGGATVWLSLDAQGNVVALEYESDTLTDAERALVTEALLHRVKFFPAKIGRISVPTRIRVELGVDSELRV